MASSIFLVATIAILLPVFGCCAKSQTPEVADNCTTFCQQDSQTFTDGQDTCPCVGGCRMWEDMNPMVDSCEASCLSKTNALESQDGDAGSTMVNCRRGCDHARDNYIRRVEGLTSKIMTDVDHNAEKGSSWLNLLVVLPENFNRSATVQYAVTKDMSRTPDSFRTSWTYVPQNLTVTEKRGYYNVTRLRYYTYYTFRLEVRATPENVFYSNITVPVLTKEGGEAPLDPPTIRDFQAVSCHDIFLTWEPPNRPNGDVVAYDIRFRNDHSFDWESESTSYSKRDYTLSKLSPGTVYYLEIRAINRNSMHGPWSKTVNVTTPLAPGNRRALGKEPAALLWANHREIRYIPDTWDFMNMRIQSEFTVYPFDHGYDSNSSAWKTLPDISAESSEAFQDFVYDTRRRLVFVLTIGGSLDVIDLNAKLRRPLLQLAEPGWVLQIQELSYDWLNMQIYFVRTNVEELWRCSVADLDHMVPQKVGVLTRDEDWSSSLKPTTRKVVADPINGYIFWLQSNSQFSSIYLSPLPVNNHHPMELHPERIVEDGYEVETFVVDFDKCRVIFPEGRRSGVPNHNQMVLATSCTTRSELQDNKAIRSGHSYGLAKDMVLFEDSFYFFSDDHLYREHKVDGGRYQVDIRPANLEYGTGSVIAMQSYNTESQPTPYPVNAPTDIQVYVATNSMYIVWQPPHEQHWQSPTAWNLWSYNVTVISENFESFVYLLDNSTTKAQVRGLLPNTTYQVQITAVKDDKSGSPSNIVHIRTYAAQAPQPEILLTTQSYLLNTTLQTNPADSQLVRQAENLHSISSIIWAPDFVAVYDAPKHLVVFPSSGSVVEEQHYDIQDAVSLAYDWIGRKVYWADLLNKKIKRASLRTPVVPELVVDGPEVRHIVLDPLRGSMYFCTDFVLETAKLNGQNRMVLMSLTPTGTVSFLGVAVDSHKKLVYAVVRKAASMEVYARSLVPSFADDGMQLVATLPISSKPTRSEIAVVDDRLLWIDGEQLAVTDMRYPHDTIKMYARISSFTRVNRFNEELKELNRAYADFRVAPNAVNESLVRLQEEGENSIKFTWPNEETNYGRVQYEVIVTDTQGKSLLAEKVTEPQVIVKDVSQEAHLQISIQPVTEWASAPVVLKRFVGQQLPRSSSWNAASIAALVVACLVLLLLIPGLFAYAYLKERKKRLSRRATPECSNRVTWDGVKSPFSENAVYDLRDLDISGLPKLNRDHISLGDFLGRGAFGAVHKGISNGELGDIPPGTPLAVKQLRPESDDGLTDFLKEACFMSQIQHPNILHFYGVCVEKEPFYIVMEYMNSGDLLSYLQSTCAPGDSPYAHVVSSLTLPDLLNMARDINQGCVYLEDTKKIHRDLAARNCLVCCEEVDGAIRRTVKIADFGMSRDVYSKDYYRRGMRRGGPGVPVKWMAPECLTENIHTTQSDVWSFGVVLYELMAYGQKGPYHDLSNDYVLEMQKRGGIHPLLVDKTMELEPTVRNIMLQCWKMNRDERPTFRSVLQVLDSLLENYLAKGEAESQGDTEVFLIDEKQQMETAILSGPGKCESFPTLRRKEYTPDLYHFYRSSPAILHQDSTGSNDSGVAITPKTVSKVIPPRSQFVMPSCLPPVVNKPQIHGSIPLDESGYLSYNPELKGPPPYLNVLGSSEEDSVGRRAPVVKPQQSSPNSFTLTMNPIDVSCSVVQDSMII